VPNFTAGTSFTDGVTNDVTAAKLNALVADAVPTSNLSLNSTTGTIATFNSTTPTFLGAITASTNTINIGSGQIYKAASGNVGISELAPTSKLEVRSGSGSNAGARATYEGAIKINESGLTTLQSTGGLEFKGSVFGSGYGSKILGADDGQLLIGNRSNSASWTERMRIDASGNVGIGTGGTAAADKLDVYGTAYFHNIELGKGGQTGNRLVTIDLTGDDTYGDYGFRVIRGDTGANADSQLVHRGTGGFYLTTIEAAFIALKTSNTERLRIDASGNITATNNFQTGDSRTTSAIKLGTFGHSIGRDSAAGALYIGGGQDSIVLQNVITSQPTYDNTAAGSAVVVTSAGLIRRTSSSLKYKKDIENLDSSIVDNAIDRLRPVWYRTKNPEGDDKSTWSHVGLIAEEVDSVEPRLVKYRTVEVSTNENGERIETQLENPVPEDVDYARLSVVLLSEVKTQRVKIASLETRLEALEAK
jgi:hypothetical protein